MSTELAWAAGFFDGEGSISARFQREQVQAALERVGRGA